MTRSLAAEARALVAAATKGPWYAVRCWNADEGRACGIVQSPDQERYEGITDAAYFVLDLEHDEFAIPALAAYAVACQDAYPDLARDLRAIVGAWSGGRRTTPNAVASALLEDYEGRK